MTWTAPSRLELIALQSLPLVNAGDDVGRLIVEALRREALTLVAGDVIVVAQKIISKAEGRLVELATVTPSRRARALAQRNGKDPRVVELILRESRAVLRVGKEVLIVEHRSGFILANAGIDQSNVNADGGNGSALLLPVDADASAARLRQTIRDATGVDCGLMIIDSIGRAWRLGTVGQTLGAAGVPMVVDARGRADLFGRKLRSTDIGVGDEIAAAASLLMGQANESRPVVVVRGLTAAPGETQLGRTLQRDRREDLFR